MFRKKDPELALAKSHEKMVAKLAAKDGGQGWLAQLSNELASARHQSSQPVTPAYQQAVGRVQSQYVFEEATGLERDRPTRGRQSVQPDGHGHGRVPMFNISGIWSARRPDTQGRVDSGRWPEHTVLPVIERPTSGPAVNYGQGGGGRPGRDGCPGCPYC